MKRKILYLVYLLPALSFGQIFQENWDGNGPGMAAWTRINVDGLTPAEDVSYVTDAWVAFDRATLGGPEGNMAAVSTSWYSPAGTANDWLISPVINLTTATGAFLKWDAKAQDTEFPDGYMIKLAPNGGNTIADFTVTLYSTAAENYYWTSRGISLTPYLGQNVRFAFVNNSTDKFVLLVDNITITQNPIVVPPTYCPFDIGTVEAISLVNFAGINNATDPDDEDNAYEDFSATSGSVIQGQTYPITLKGNTVGDYDNYFTLYADWNQDGQFDDPNEVYEIGFITSSSGNDDIALTGNIAVPANATLGTVRIRIIKNFDEFSLSPCETEDSEFLFGQAEDYSVVVNATAKAADFDKSGFSYYPNPVNNSLNLSYTSEIESVSIYNLMGQEVLKTTVKATEGQVDVSSLATGTYIAKINTSNSFTTIKIIKQ